MDAGKCIDTLLTTITKLDPDYDPFDVDAWEKIKMKLHKGVTHTKKCPICESEFESKDKDTVHCSRNCYIIYLSNRARKMSPPSLDQLLEDLRDSTITGVGRKYGMSHNAVRKWLKKYGVDPKSVKNNINAIFLQKEI